MEPTIKIIASATIVRGLYVCTAICAIHTSFPCLITPYITSFYKSMPCVNIYTWNKGGLYTLICSVVSIWTSIIDSPLTASKLWWPHHLVIITTPLKLRHFAQRECKFSFRPSISPHISYHEQSCLHTTCISDAVCTPSPCILISRFASS